VVRRPGLWELALLVKNSDIVHPRAPRSAFVLALLRANRWWSYTTASKLYAPMGSFTSRKKTGPAPATSWQDASECLRCNRDMGLFVSWQTVVAHLVRRFLCAHASMNITETDWLRQLLWRSRPEPFRLVWLRCKRKAKGRSHGPPVIALSDGWLRRRALTSC
jgi:hypothetical protein